MTQAGGDAEALKAKDVPVEKTAAGRHTLEADVVVAGRGRGRAGRRHRSGPNAGANVVISGKAGRDRRRHRRAAAASCWQPAPTWQEKAGTSKTTPDQLLYDYLKAIGRRPISWTKRMLQGILRQFAVADMTWLEDMGVKVLRRGGHPPVAHPLARAQHDQCGRPPWRRHDRRLRRQHHSADDGRSILKNNGADPLRHHR